MITELLAGVGHALGDPWGQEVVRRAFVEVALLGVAAGALGCWVVLSELAYTTESLAHALLPGLVLAALLGLPLLLGGAVGLLVAAGGLAATGRVPVLGRDAAVAVVVTGLFGLGVLLGLSPAAPADLQGLLFGDVLGVGNRDLALAVALAIVVALVLWRGHSRLLAVGFDPTGARALGLSVRTTEAALLGLLALTTLVAVPALGTLLVLAVVIAPAASARLLVRRMGPAIALAGALAVVGGWGGLYLSYWVGSAAGASVAGVLVLLYLGAATLAARRGRAGSSRFYHRSRAAR